MTQSRLITGALVIAVAAGLLFYFLRDRKKHFNWYESFDSESTQPYGLKYMKSLLQEKLTEDHFRTNKNQPLSRLLNDSTWHKTNPGTYLFAGHQAHYSIDDVFALYSFVERGNHAWITSQQLPEHFIENLYTGCGELGYLPELKLSGNLNFYNDQLKVSEGYEYIVMAAESPRPYAWHFVPDSSVCSVEHAMQPLGYNEPGNTNFLKISYGKGAFYFHTDPIVFTNFFLRDENKLDYFEKSMSMVPLEDVVWDDYSRLPYYSGEDADQSPLYYILQQPSLKYAWWLFISTILVFVIFTAKRKQRAIPVVEPKNNSTLAFVEMVSALHYQNGDHLDIARKKMRYFLYFIRHRYGVQISNFTEDYVPIVTERSGVPLESVRYLYERWNVIHRFGQSGIEEQRLTDLYWALRSFYLKCK